MTDRKCLIDAVVCTLAGMVCGSVVTHCNAGCIDHTSELDTSREEVVTGLCDGWLPEYPSRSACMDAEYAPLDAACVARLDGDGVACVEEVNSLFVGCLGELPVDRDVAVARLEECREAHDVVSCGEVALALDECREVE